jgi:hypothetical protein
LLKNNTGTLLDIPVLSPGWSMPDNRGAPAPERGISFGFSSRAPIIGRRSIEA